MIFQSWAKYIQELYNDDREDTDMLFNEEEPPIVIVEVEDAIKQTRQRKTPGHHYRTNSGLGRIWTSNLNQNVQ
jgi:hypothetical protein